MRNWYLVYCKPRGEQQAKDNLERQGFRVYLPMVRQPRKFRGRRVIRIEPLFPRYLFIHLDTVTDNWAPIRSTLGVNSLVRFGPDPAIVPEDLVEILMSRDDERGVQSLPLDDMKEGDTVQIVEGPLMGYEGLLLAKSSSDRVLILLDIVGKKTRVKVDSAHLEVTKKS